MYQLSCALSAPRGLGASFHAFSHLCIRYIANALALRPHVEEEAIQEEDQEVVQEGQEKQEKVQEQEERRQEGLQVEEGQVQHQEVDSTVLFTASPTCGLAAPRRPRWARGGTSSTILLYLAQPRRYSTPRARCRLVALPLRLTLLALLPLRRYHRALVLALFLEVSLDEPAVACQVRRGLTRSVVARWGLRPWGRWGGGTPNASGRDGLVIEPEMCLSIPPEIYNFSQSRPSWFLEVAEGVGDEEGCLCGCEALRKPRSR